MTVQDVQQRTPSTIQMTYLEAVIQAQIEEMERDSSIIMLGEDITVYGGRKIVERFDESRVRCMPISENSFTGMGIGAAIAGLRPIVDINIASFAYLASDQIINQAAKLSFMTGGQINVPVVFRFCMYYGASIAAQHSDRPYPMFMNVPGLKIICPTTPADVKGLLKSAIRDNDPVIIFEDTKLWTMKGEVSTDPNTLVPIGQAIIRQPGTDVTLVAIAGAMRPALDAAEALKQRGVSVELVDLRTLKPLDTPCIARSVRKTGRLVVVENAHGLCGLGAEIAATIADEVFADLKSPIKRLAAPDVHVPFAPTLEALLYPSTEQIVEVIIDLVGHGGRTS